ncbi:MAG TPA: hypothetical protein VEM58_06230 [Streptosporangiaceae bacterium]|nr:hypothetical protein [Streptosporangiaceae bacterium]
MPGPLSARPHRSKGSWIPRLAGVGVVALIAAGGLVGYLLSAHHVAPRKHRHTVLSSRVLKKETVGIIDFGPDDDHDAFARDADDHPLMLQPGQGRLEFVAIPAAELTAGVPVWTANQMSDGSDIFIYTATGQCLSDKHPSDVLRLAHCDLGLSQRWRPLDATTALQQEFAKYANAKTGLCLTAPSKHPGPATLQRCGPPRLKNQEIAFWWNA